MSRIRAIAALAAVLISAEGGSAGYAFSRAGDDTAHETGAPGSLTEEVVQLISSSRRAPIEQLRRLAPEPELILSLGEILRRGPAPDRFKAAATLGDLGSPFARLTLVAARHEETDGEVLRLIDEIVQGAACREPGMDIELTRDFLEQISMAGVVEAVPTMGRLAEQRPELRPDVVSALGRMGGPAAMRELSRMRNYVSDASERRSLHDAIQTAGGFRDGREAGPRGRAPAPPEANYFRTVFEKLALEYNVDPTTLPARGETSRVLALLDGFLAHGRPEAHHSVLAMLTEIDDPGTPLILMNVLARHPDPVLRMQAHHALQESHTGGVESDFERATREPLTRDGIEALFSQIEVRDARHTIPYMQRILGAWPTQTARMVECFAKLEAREVVPALMKLKTDPAVLASSITYAAVQSALIKLGAGTLMAAQLPADGGDPGASDEAATEEKSSAKPAKSEKRSSTKSKKGKSVGKTETVKEEKKSSGSELAKADKKSGHVKGTTDKKKSSGKSVEVAKATEPDKGKGKSKKESKEPAKSKKSEKGKKSRARDEDAGTEEAATASGRGEAQKMSYASIHADRMDELRFRQDDALALAQARASARLQELGRSPARTEEKVEQKVQKPLDSEVHPPTALFSEKDLPEPARRMVGLTRGPLGRGIPEPFLGSIEIARDEPGASTDAQGLGLMSESGLGAVLGAPPQHQPQDTRLSRVAQNLQVELARPHTSWERLASRTSRSILLPALDEVMQRGTTSAREEAARVLSEASEPAATLILLDHVRRHGDLPTARAIVKALDGWRAAGVPYAKAMQCPVAEEKFAMFCEDLIVQERRDMVPYLQRVLETWPEYGVPVMRAVAHLSDASSAPYVKRYIGYTAELDAEAIGALALLGVDYELNRERLARALPRAAEMGEKCLPVYETTLHYLAACAVRRHDGGALKPVFYIPPHAAEPFRTEAMGVLSRTARTDMKAFVAGLAQIQYVDRQEFMKEFVAYLNQKDLVKEWQTAYKQAFLNLDLGYAHYDVAQELEKRVATF